jgi:hypothetical protein
MKSTLLSSFGEMECRRVLALTVMATSLTVMQRHPMLSEKMTAAVNGVRLFHGRVSRMLDGVVYACVADVGRL